MMKKQVNGNSECVNYCELVTSIVRDSYIVNADFEGLRAAELVDDSLANWCHHIQYILPQVLLSCDKE